MAFSKYAKAKVVKPNIAIDTWRQIRRVASVKIEKTATVGNVSLKDFDPDKYLLSHATIMASVDTEAPVGVVLGQHMVDGFQVDRRFPDYYVTPETAKYSNQNMDAWERKLLLSTFKTFIGAANYCEHIQVPELNKGRIIDAAARDIGDSVYIDILVATERKHRELIAAITSGRLGTLSMGCNVLLTVCSACGNVAEDETCLCPHIRYLKGNTFSDALGKQRKIVELCFVPGTRVVLANGLRVPIEDVQVGDLVLSHKGRKQPVRQLLERYYEGGLTTIDVEGLPQTIKATPEHPFWVMSPRDICVCGCNQPMAPITTFSRAKYWRMYKQGHNPQGVIALQEPEFSFKMANQLKRGDILALPIPSATVVPADVDVDKAELLGWFLAEGSYLKRDGVRHSVQFTLNAEDEQEVAARLAKLLANSFEPEVRTNPPSAFREPVFGKTDAILRATFGKEALVSEIVAEIGYSNGIRESLARYVRLGLVRSRALAPNEHPELKGRHRSRTRLYFWCGDEAPASRRVAKKLSSEALRIVELMQKRARMLPRIHTFPRSEGGYKLVVAYRNTKAANWFYEHAGEYSGEKRLPDDAIFWPKALQKAMLKAYVHGDGSVDTYRRHHVSSVSDKLISQMQIVAARCGIWTRRQVIYEGHAIKLCEAVGAGTVPVGSDGCRPRHELHFQPSATITKFFGMTTSVVRGSEPRFHEYKGYMLYPIRSVGRENYSGIVHNISVAEDESYLVEGLATHNCGHVTVPNSTTFIEASWVGNPAFKGAVLRSILMPSEAKSFGSKIQDAFSTPVPTINPNMLQKAAAQQVSPEQDIDNFSELPEPKQEEKPDALQKAVDELTDVMRERVIKRIREDIGKDEVSQLRDPNLNDTLIKSAMQHPVWRKLAHVAKQVTGDSGSARKLLLGLVLYRSGNLKRASELGLSGKDILALTRFVHILSKKPLMAGDARLYRTVVAAGKLSKYKTSDAYLRKCQKVIGRDLTETEQRKLVSLARLYDMGE